MMRMRRDQDRPGLYSSQFSTAPVIGSLVRASGFYRHTVHSVRWQAHSGWCEHVHMAPRQMLNPAWQTANFEIGHDTAQPPQAARAGIPQVWSSPCATAPVDAARLHSATTPYNPAETAKRRMHPPVMARRFPEMPGGAGIDVQRI
jgi:hypothetical protein